MKLIHPFIDYLHARTAVDLPGVEAHRVFMPLLDNKMYRTFKPKQDSYSSAVLILLVPAEKNGDLSILYTLRSNTLDSHGGQISFPGGHSENNESARQTALRETFEEVGIEEKELTIVGELSPLYVAPSNAVIAPIVAYCAQIPEMNINPKEVEEVFFISLSELKDKKNIKTEIWNYKGLQMQVPFWNLHRTTPLWGATAMITSELLVLYEEFLNKNKFSN